MSQAELVQRLRASADESARKALRRAEDLARERGDKFLGVEHLFLALAESETVLGALEGLGASLESIRRAMDAYGLPFSAAWESTVITPRARAILSAAASSLLPGERLSVGKVLSALLRDPDAAPVRALGDLGVDVRGLLGALQEREGERGAAAGAASPRAAGRTPCLDELGLDLTKAAAGGALDPLIGRERELEQVIDVLCLRRAANPLLVGDPGVGKTAIVEGLAQRIAAGQIETLRGCRLVSLSTTALLSGMGVVGALQERVQSILRELRENPGVILFIDEIHSLVSAGANPALDASQMLLPALARGDIRCVGATTNAEYRRIIQPAGPLARRFEVVPVAELSDDATRDVLRGLRTRLERHYLVTVPEDAIDGALRISGRFEHRRRHPDKALRLLERAAVKAMRAGTKEVLLDHIVEAVCDLVPDLDPLFVHHNEDVLRDLEVALLRDIKGQDEAVGTIARAMRRFHGPLQQDSMRPRGVLLFAGPTGVGKTLAAKVLAEILFGSRQAMIRIDMSEYMERHDVSKIVGAPPGYVGYEEGGQLTSAIWDRPHSIVLLDEIDKAHPEVLSILLQVLDDGFLTDGRGRKVMFTNATIIMTTNRGAAAGQVSRSDPVGFRAEAPCEPARASARFADAVLQVLKSEVAPELLNRIDEKVIFQPLSGEACGQIVDLEVERIAEQVRASGADLRIELADEARGEILRRADFERFGAREIERCVRAIVGDYLLANWKRLLSRRRLRIAVSGNDFAWHED